MASPGNPGGGHVYIEFVVQGRFVKAKAILAKSGTEASVMGRAGTPRSVLSYAAMRKPNRGLKKQIGRS